MKQEPGNASSQESPGFSRGEEVKTRIRRSGAVLQIDLAQIAPKRRSVSQFSTYMSCGEQYRLSRVAQAPQRPAAWFAMGSAVHEVIEQWELWDRQGTIDQAKQYICFAWSMVPCRSHSSHCSITSWTALPLSLIHI